MLEVVLIGLGGGSKVYVDEVLNCVVVVGLGFVGYLFIQEVMVFGGKILILIDIVVFVGKVEFGDLFFVKNILVFVVESG